MKVNHYGIAVRDFSNAIESYISLGFRQIDNEINIDKENNVKFIRIKDALGKIFKIIGIADNSKSSLISTILNESNFPAVLFYIAMETKDIEGKISEMVKRGYSIIYEQKQDHAFSGRHAILYNKNIGNIKLMQV